MNLRTVNKKTFESLAMAGAFDCFGNMHRKQYLENGEGPSAIELIIRYGNSLQNEAAASQQSLFGGDSGVAIPMPKIRDTEPFSDIEKLRIEKDVVGFYISGHPLDQFKLEIDNFCTCKLDEVEKYKGQSITIAGIVTKFTERQTKRGKPFGLFSIEDFEGSSDLALFGEPFMKFRHMLSIGQFVYLTGIVEERYNQPGVWEFQTKNVELLSEIREKKAKSLTINLSLNQIDSDIIHQLEELSIKHSGDCELKLVVVDEQERINLELLSRKYKINPDNELISELEAMPINNYLIGS